MRTADYIEQGWANLWKKKLRTFLTTSGVVIGIGALVCMFAFGQGIQRNITGQFEEMELFNYISVSAGDSGRGAESRPDPDEPRDDAAYSGVLDERALREIMAIDGVVAAFPEMRFPAQIRLDGKEQFTLVQVLPASAFESGLVQFRAGRAYATNEPNELVISDILLRRLGVKSPETAVGREIEVRTLTLNLDFVRLVRMALGRDRGGLPFSSRPYTFTIAGVTQRMGFGGPLPVRSDVIVPPTPAQTMQKLALTSLWDFFEPSDNPGVYSAASIKVTSPTVVPAVKKALEARGLKTFALMDQLGQMKTGFVIMDMFLLAVGMIGITVASLGIVNTMVMSILERYREIGIMKAVGATDGDVQKIFLFESGMIGFLGGLFGLGLGWVVSFIINEVVNAFSTREGVPYIHYFSFPWWLCLGAIAFSISVSLIAGIYPTLRAARVDPVVALRHD